ncbi:MAG TPA: NUDIX domain-containing protein, partial [Puia sp.]|nr:NUDIX domain-containing protein [Puia sp.]
NAALRRLQEEMGFSTALEKSFDFIYRTEFGNGLTEHEFDHVFVGFFDGAINPDAAEVSDYCFRSPDEICSDLASIPDRFTVWFHLAFPLIAAARTSAGQPIGPLRP